jgi:hypothetical protein
MFVPEGIDYQETPSGFLFTASLATYWAILPLAFMAITTCIVIVLIDPAALIGKKALLNFLIALLAVPTGVLIWWNSLLRGFGTQTVAVENSTLFVSVGIGPVKWRRQFDLRMIRSVSEERGHIAMSEYGPANMAVVFGPHQTNATTDHQFDQVFLWPLSNHSAADVRGEQA